MNQNPSQKELNEKYNERCEREYKLHERINEHIEEMDLLNIMLAITKYDICYKFLKDVESAKKKYKERKEYNDGDSIKLRRLYDLYDIESPVDGFLSIIISKIKKKKEKAEELMKITNDQHDYDHLEGIIQLSSKALYEFYETYKIVERIAEEEI